jgi:hypothetical protein
MLSLAVLGANAALSALASIFLQAQEQKFFGSFSQKGHPSHLVTPDANIAGFRG